MHGACDRRVLSYACVVRCLWLFSVLWSGGEGGLTADRMCLAVHAPWCPESHSAQSYVCHPICVALHLDIVRRLHTTSLCASFASTGAGSSGTRSFTVSGMRCAVPNGAPSVLRIDAYIPGVF